MIKIKTYKIYLNLLTLKVEPAVSKIIIFYLKKIIVSKTSLLTNNKPLSSTATPPACLPASGRLSHSGMVWFYLFKTVTGSSALWCSLIRLQLAPILNIETKINFTNNVLDTLINNNLLVINSPFEETNLVGLLYHTMMMNVYSVVVLIVLFTTFLQIVVVIQQLNLEFIDKLLFLKILRVAGPPIKRIILKWQKLSSKTLFIYFFVWWVLLCISVYYTIDNLQFVLDNLDSLIDQHNNFKK